MGNMLAVTVSLGIPNAEEMPGGIDLSWVGVALRPAATAAGIWLVGNIGRQKVTMIKKLVETILKIKIKYCVLFDLARTRTFV